MSERSGRYLSVVGRGGPAFGVTDPGRRVVRVEGPGLAAALVDLGGLPEDGAIGELVVEDAPRVPGTPRVAGSTRLGPVEQLARQCGLVRGHPAPVRGYEWEADRGWRFDLAWPSRLVAVVVDAGRRVGGRMVPGAGWCRDAEPLNEAAVEGWMVLRVTVAMIEDGRAIGLIARALAAWESRR